MKIEDVEGIGPIFAQKLQAAGVNTTDDLLDRGGSKAGRASLASASGLTETQLLEWVNHADLMRISGVGSEYADLLEAAGVDSCAELAQRNAANLAVTFQELDAARPNWIRQIPSEATVEAWIVEAKTMEAVVAH
jgi:predicted flap endonuclease-1-like 5' DNA nuclease